MLLFAVFLFHETYSLAQFTAFGFIWLGIIVFTYGTTRTVMKTRKLAK
jgi:chloramphenicol-sensitive protein RarD